MLSCTTLMFNYNNDFVAATTKVGLNYDVLNAFRGNRNIGVVVGVKNQDLQALAVRNEAISTWFMTNIEPYLADSLTNLVKSRSLPVLISTTVAMTNLGQSYSPSTADFTPQAHTIMVQDGSLGYSNMFDVIFDAFVWAMEKEGVKDLPMVVAETGWPSAGNRNLTTPYIASRYNRNFVKHVDGGKGTPKRPKNSIDGFLFAMFNKNQKPGGTEQNFGLYYHMDMKPIYKLF
ncbi:unnamed protein product [Arabis nemorensis]|uniref:glucan endo-1,3-beta-D-glucosidase n=1 Tax=Arabis nemorensis TaxID=586526 RepID=A0A565AUG5_9BRAS|nr:unnamed protein product [Arabis nemorensis]